MTRALDGQVETVTRPDGSTISRHRYDNRTAMALLARLDRMVESAPADPAAAADAHAARFVAQDFEPYLDLLERDGGPARAGLFLARRTGLAESAPTLEPVLALARADTFARTGAALPEEVATADLDPAQRAGWTAEQWCRAEAAGLLRVAAPPPPPEESRTAPPLPPHRTEPAEPIWWDDKAEDDRTDLPPPEKASCCSRKAATAATVTNAARRRRSASWSSLPRNSISPPSAPPPRPGATAGSRASSRASPAPKRPPTEAGRGPTCRSGR